MQPGRSCPLDYRYAPEALGAAHGFECETLYVVGGLYGNPYALDRVLDMAAAERKPVALAFNGDFNWFDVDDETFARINETVMRHVALRGNVETELAADERDAGCGCGYPEWVADAEVERSNAILRRLRDTALRFPAVRAALGALPMHAVARVGGLRIGIVHGDAHGLAGWAYAHESLAGDDARARIAEDFERAGVRVIASSHTCLPVATDCTTRLGRCVLMNNGAAGMPNFRGARHGIITRIATSPAQRPLYGTRLGAVRIDALAVAYDHDAWLRDFRRNWPPGSPAHESYHRRIAEGPGYDPRAAPRWRAAEPADA